MLQVLGQKVKVQVHGGSGVRENSLFSLVNAVS